MSERAYHKRYYNSGVQKSTVYLKGGKIMLTFFSWVTGIMLVPYVVVGIGSSFYMYRKRRIGKKVGMKRDSFLEEHFIGLMCAIPVVLLGGLFGCLHVENEESALWFFVSFLTTVLFLAFFFLSCVLVWTILDDWKGFKGLLADLKNNHRFSTYFGSMEAGAGNRTKFKELFNFYPFENTVKDIEYQLNKNRDEKALIEIAKAYHQLIALEELKTALPNGKMLKESDKQAVNVLNQQINEFKKALQESAEVIRSMVIHNENVHFSEGQLKALQQVRKMAVQPTPEKTFIHPTLEALIQVQTMPGVTEDRVQEAKRLEVEIKERLKERKTPWSPNELADSNLKAVKLHHGIE